MKVLLTLLLSLLAAQTYSQNLPSVALRWKIDKNEPVRYATVMEDIDTASVDLNFGGLFKALADSTQKGLAESKDLFKKLNSAVKSQDYITTLSNKGGGVIDIVMTTRPKERPKDTKKDPTGSKEAEVMNLLQSMNQGVMLRGSVYEGGGIHSFWVKSTQKNLVALLFELPTTPVKVGDHWSLDIDFIANDQNFDCDSAYKVNEVTLSGIKQVNGQAIAILKYNLAEYVKGRFYAPSFLTGNDGGQQEMMMKFTHQGMAEFSLDEGRWVSYDGIMSLEATGVMTAHKSTKFTLVPASR